MSELKQAMLNPKKKKSPGPDNITNEMLINLENTALEKMIEIFNLSWKEGKVPQIWRETLLIPIKDEQKGQYGNAQLQKCFLLSRI